MTNSICVAPKPSVTEEDFKGLKTAHRQEAKLIKEGWRYYKINDRLRVLVPFGKDGKPTKKGRRMIENRKNAI